MLTDPADLLADFNRTAHAAAITGGPSAMARPGWTAIKVDTAQIASTGHSAWSDSPGTSLVRLKGRHSHDCI